MKSEMIWWLILFTVVGAVMMLLDCGCNSANHKPDPTPGLDPNVVVNSAPMVVTKLVYKTDWLTTIAVVGIAVSAAAFVMGQSYALPIFAGCSALLTTILTMAQYSKWIAFVGLTISLVIFVYTVMQNNKIKSNLKTAFEEVVTGVEAVKDRILNDPIIVQNDITDKVSEVKKIINGTLEDCQSPVTIDMVKEVKSSIVEEVKSNNIESQTTVTEEVKKDVADDSSVSNTSSSPTGV